MSDLEHGAIVAEHLPPKKRWTIPGVIAVLVLLVISCGGLLLRRAEGGVNKVAMSAEPKSVAVVESRASTFRPTKRYIGTLEPWLSARVGPQLAAGFVDTVLVRPGAVVKRGDVLATLDCRSSSAGNQAIAQQARALEARQKAASREATRLGELLDGGFASANEVEQKQAQSAANEAQILSLLAQASGKSLEVGDCVLRAPFDGEVAVRTADPGTFVRPGSSIVEVVDRSVVRLTGDVPEIDFDAVPPGTKVRIHLLSTGKDVTGEIARRAPSADPSTRTIHFEIDLQNPSRDFPVGTTAEMTVEVGEPEPATEIPLLAAKVRGKAATIFVVDGATVKSVTVPVVGERGGSLFVKPELPAGARVVTQGRSLLANNDHVVAKLEAPKP
ncbi:MAG TPA: efflux RND transporter periplasmic adaptor subunit [Labilithrix sp.]|nr:efflux RND transporter periplasmic adaptor subunit [Labilithrix sp.]